MALVYVILTASICNFFLGFYVWKNNPRSRANVSFGIMSLVIGAWIFANFLFQYSQSIIFARTTYGIAAFLPSVGILWLLCFKDRQLSTFCKVILIALFAGGSLFLALVYFDKLVIVRVIDRYEIQTGPLFPFYSIFMFLSILILFFTLFHVYRASNGTKRVRVKYVLMGIGIVTVLTSLVSLVLPLFEYLRFSILDSPSALLFVGFSAYAMIRHRLMDLRALVLKSVAYSIVLGIIAGAYALATQFVMRWFQGASYQTGFNIAVIFAAIFGFNPLRRFVEKYTDRIFAKGRYDFKEVVGKLGNIASEKVNLADLAHSTLEILTKDMRVRKAAFVVTESPQVTEVDVIGYKSKSKTTWEKVAKLVRNNQIIVTDELEDGNQAKDVLRKMQVDVVVPLPAEDKIVGLLALGEKRSGDMYTSEDLKLLEVIAPEEAIAVHKARLFRLNEERITELNSINKLALEIGSTLDLDKLLSEALDEAIKVTGAETGSIMLLDKKGENLSIRTARGIPKELCRKRIKVGEGIAGWVAQKEQPLCLIDGQHQELRKHLKREEITSSLSVPLKVRDKLIGVLSVNRKKKRELFTDANLRVISSFATQAAEAIENARLYEKSESQFMETIRALSGAVEAKDPYTKGHSDAVTRYAVLIAKEMDFSEEELRNIEVGGGMHDIGKIGVPEAILNKPGKLTDEERKIIEEHPKIGAHILKNAPSLKEIMPIMLYHHERWDGKGYPTGLAGEAIPLEARIMAVVDSFNAMTSDRPYRKALPLQVAIDELKRCSGGQFDPKVVEVFLRILDREKETFEEEKDKEKEIAKLEATKAA